MKKIVVYYFFYTKFHYLSHPFPFSFAKRKSLKKSFKICSMCAGAIIQSRIRKIYYGTKDLKTGAVGSVFNLLEDYTFNHHVEYE